MTDFVNHQQAGLEQTALSSTSYDSAEGRVHCVPYIHSQESGSSWATQSRSTKWRSRCVYRSPSRAYARLRVDDSTGKENHTMAQESHKKAAEHHETAAKSHKAAADLHEKGDHAAAEEHSTKAHASSTEAHKHSTEAHGKSAAKKK